MKRAALMFLCLGLSAQTSDVIGQAHGAYNEFAKTANEWSTQHDDLIRSPQDSERLLRMFKAFDKFHRLAKEAHL